MPYPCTEQWFHHVAQTAAEDVCFDELAADPGSPRPVRMPPDCLQAILTAGRCFAWEVVPELWAVVVVVVVVAEDVDEKGEPEHSEFGAGISWSSAIAAGVIAGRVDRSWAFDEAQPQEQLGWDQHPEWGENRPSIARPLAKPPLDLLLCLGLLPRAPAEPRGISTICVLLAPESVV